MRFSLSFSLLYGWLAVAPIACAQSTLGSIAGVLRDPLHGIVIGGAEVEIKGATSGITVRSQASGYYYAGSLTPGIYTIRVSAKDYQPQELREVRVNVAAIVEADFRLRPLSDVWEQGMSRSILTGSRAVLTFAGPDLDASRLTMAPLNHAGEGGYESNRSDVVSAKELRELPLSGRDAYTMLVTVAGISADAGTARGIGVSANGQRPSSSNFLLDGVENNNDLVSGPLYSVAPEALGEYRISKGLFTAEYGRTNGVLANAMTAGGTDRWHGLAYFYFNQEQLNANSFQRNLQGLARAPRLESQPGFVLGGPLWRKRWFASAAMEWFRSRTEDDPVEATLPSARYPTYLTGTGFGSRLLDQYRAPFPDVPSVVGTVRLSPPKSVDRWYGLYRLEHQAESGKYRTVGRVLTTRQNQPDFIWTPYPDFVSPLRQTGDGFALSLVMLPSAGFLNEVRAGYSGNSLRWERPHPEIPTLQSSDNYAEVLLPGSLAFYDFHYGNRKWELTDSLSWSHGAHTVKLGGNLLLRGIESRLLPGEYGRYLFNTLFDFDAGQPAVAEGVVVLASLPMVQVPKGGQTFRNIQVSAYAQDTWRASRRLVVNAGLRYENFGAPVATGQTVLSILRLGDGTDFGSRLRSGSLLPPAVCGCPIYERDNNNLAARLGFSYGVGSSGRTFLRSSFGVFYDRPFDNLWQNASLNGLELYEATFPSGYHPASTLPAIGDALRNNPGYPLEFFHPVLYQPGIRDGYSLSYFSGLLHELREGLTVEVNGTGSQGRKLISTDRVNRFSEWNSDLPWISYRANQGGSSYHALELVGRWRLRRLTGQAAYTWSHSIDNQSDPLSGDYFDLNFTTQRPGQPPKSSATFSRELDSRGDRGSSDFDQRHSLVVWSILELPEWRGSRTVRRVTQGWRIAALAAVRSGFPFTVFAPSDDALDIFDRRANLASPDAEMDVAATGGRVRLNPKSFAQPQPGAQGSLGRNGVSGPGFYNVDLSVSRTVPLRERIRLVFRADLLNVLNHTNLQTPVNFISSPDFGVAVYGRQGQVGFPAQAPFQELGRRVQLMMQVHF